MYCEEFEGWNFQLYILNKKEIEDESGSLKYHCDWDLLADHFATEFKL